MKSYVFFALIALSHVGCSAAADPTGACTFSDDAGALDPFCQDGVAQGDCESTDGTVQQGVKVHAAFSESSCKDGGYTDTCDWSSASDGDKYRCKPAPPMVLGLCTYPDHCAYAWQADCTGTFTTTGISCPALGYPNPCSDGVSYCK